nr:hypothetical protein [Tanacetum cinerariifolium]
MTGTIAKPVFEEYITVTRKNYISKNDGGKIVEKSFLELKGKFLEKLARDALSGTNREDVVEHIKKFLNLVKPINIQNVSSNRLRLSVFQFRTPVLQNNMVFERLLASDFENYMMMDHITMNALRKIWKKNNDQKGTTFGRIDEGVNNNREPCDDRIKDSENENEVAEIFRIETDVFSYESPMCKEFDEFNYLVKIDPDVLTKDIP